MSHKNHLKDITGILEETGIPFAYDHFAEGESPEPPFITFLIPGTDNFPADGRVYLKAEEVHIELYTDRKDPALEQRIEDILDAHDIYYDRTEVWIEPERLYEVLWSYERKVEDHAEETE